MRPRVAIVTGANSGVGFETAVGLASEGISVVMACRSQKRAEEAKERILSRVEGAKLDILLLDLNSLASVRRFVDEYKRKYDHLDLLVNNAGILRYDGQRTDDGFEAQMGVNYLGHFLLTALLIDIMPDTSDSRIVSVSSVAHKSVALDIDDLDCKRFSSYENAYNKSKLACLMFSGELQHRLADASKKILSVCAHPGGTDTGIFDALSRPYYYFVKFFVAPFVAHSNESAARPLLYAALADDVAGGEYFGPQGMLDLKGPPGRAERSEYSRDRMVAKRLWGKSEELLKCEFRI